MKGTPGIPGAVRRSPDVMEHLGSTYVRVGSPAARFPVFDMSSLAPAFSASTSYFGCVDGVRGQFATYGGALWERVRSILSPAAKAPPEDMYDEKSNPAGHWRRADVLTYLRGVEHVACRALRDLAVLREEMDDEQEG